MKTDDDRHTARVLRFLGKGDASISASAAEDRLLLDGGERGMLGLRKELLRNLLRSGQVVAANGRLRLSPTGGMALKRDEAPVDPYRAQHQECEAAIVLTDTVRETVCVNGAESPLAMLWRRRGKDGARFLSDPEFRAGERLRVDYSRGCLMPSLGVSWAAIGGAGGRSPGGAGGTAELGDAALAARLRVEKAITSVGPELAGVLIDVCCFLKGLEIVEAERGWPARSAKVVLKSALSALARHYEPPRRKSGSASSILHWGTADYRPRVGQSGGRSGR